MRIGIINEAMEGRNVRKTTSIAVSAALLLLGGFPPVAPAAAPPSSVAAPETVIKAVLPDGSPAAGAVITFGGKRYVADAQGTAKGPGIFRRPRLVTGDLVRQEGGVLGFFRKSVHYGAFLPVETAAGPPREIRLPLAQVAEMDEACRACHPSKATENHPFERCVHKSGVPLKPAMEARVSQFNKENDNLRNTGKPAYPPIAPERRKVRKGLFGETREYLVCLTCHSNHVDSGYKAYVLMPFSDKSVLCLGCHV